MIGHVADAQLLMCQVVTGEDDGHGAIPAAENQQDRPGGILEGLVPLLRPSVRLYDRPGRHCPSEVVSLKYDETRIAELEYRATTTKCMGSSVRFCASRGWCRRQATSRYETTRAGISANLYDSTGGLISRASSFLD